MELPGSVSEDHGLALLTDDDLRVYSVGISTGGLAETRMAHTNPKRHITATTIDETGVDFARKYIAQQHLQNQIEAKLEDVAKPLPYADNYFDYIYARLVLHYLPKDVLDQSLAELHRILRSGGKLFVVVRSTKCPDATQEKAVYDPETHLTTATFTDKETGKMRSYSRYFHTEESIRTHVAAAGFNVAYVEAYDEYLYMDFMRTKRSQQTDNVIELLASK